jgi:hypothetical protein
MSLTNPLMRRLTSALVLIATVATSLAAQTHPNFAGKWVLDPKSVDGGMGPVSMTLTIAQDAKTISTESVAQTPMGEQKSSRVLNLDGSPSKSALHTPGGDLELTATSSWDGNVFVVATKGDVQGQPITYNERWSLDADGKTLHIQRDGTAMGQAISLKMTFNKE